MSSSKNFNQLWQGIQELKETMLIQNKRLDKLTTIENKLDGIQKKMVEYENKLNQLEKEQLRDKMVQKTNLLVFQLHRQYQYIRRENILIYGVEENKEDNDDGEKVLFKIADELEIDLEDNEIQRVHRLGQKRRNNENPRPIIACGLGFACTRFYFNLPCNRITHITFYTQSKRRLLTIVHYSLYKISSFALGRSAA